MSYDTWKNGFASIPNGGDGCDICHGYDDEPTPVTMEIFGKDEEVYLCRQCRIEYGYIDEDGA